MARKRIMVDKTTGIPVDRISRMEKRMHDIRKELGKSFTKSYDEHNNAIAQMWMNHSTTNPINS